MLIRLRQLKLCELYQVNSVNCYNYDKCAGKPFKILAIVL